MLRLVLYGINADRSRRKISAEVTGESFGGKVCLKCLIGLVKRGQSKRNVVYAALRRVYDLGVPCKLFCC